MPDEQASTASTTMPAKILLSVEEAAAMLGIHRATVYDLLAKGQLPSVRIGRRRLIAHRTLEDFVVQNERSAVSGRLSAPAAILDSGGRHGW